MLAKISSAGRGFGVSTRPAVRWTEAPESLIGEIPSQLSDAIEEIGKLPLDSSAALIFASAVPAMAQNGAKAGFLS
jgi:hypothetical protein